MTDTAVVVCLGSRTIQWKSNVMTAMIVTVNGRIDFAFSPLLLFTFDTLTSYHSACILLLLSYRDVAVNGANHFSFIQIQTKLVI